MKPRSLQVPFGAVYFRKSNPPRSDWESDYATAAEDGLNVFRHWFMWGAIERSPGVYDWDDYDRQMDLAARYGLRSIIAEFTQAPPDWALRRFPEARQRLVDGRVVPSIMSQSSVTGGFARSGGGAGTLSMNDSGVLEAVGQFLTVLAERYKDHPSLLGYDVWNECNYSPLTDYSEPAKAAFRRWLRERYGTLDALANIWHRYSYAEWDDIEPPTQLAPYPESLDWIRFRKENNYEAMQFRIDTLRAVDSKCLMTAHGIAGSITDMASRGCDDWLAASKVDIYGYTWIAGRRGAEPWRNFFGADLVRGATRGRTFWHSERQGGPLWMQPQVLGRDRNDGRVAEPEDIRLWSMSSFAGGARGMMNLRYRPLLDGPLFGAFGSYAMDGSRTPRSAMASALANWTNAPEQREAMDARAVRGDIGILVVPEVQEFDHLLSGEGRFDTYKAAMWGAYRGFFDNNIQADWVHIDDLDAYDAIYFPYPILMSAGQAARLQRWVEGGGALIAEACPGYFGEHGRAGSVQPNHGLDTLFGCREENVEFMPDIAARNSFEYDGLRLSCGGFRQSYALAGGAGRGEFDDGDLAIVEHRAGKGRTLLIGTHPTVGYYREPSEAGRRFFTAMLDWCGREPMIKCSNPSVQARVHEGASHFVWIVNPTRQVQRGELNFASTRAGTSLEQILWGEQNGGLVQGNRFAVGPRDALVVLLRR